MESEVLRAANATEFGTPERCFILEVANDERDTSLSISRARVPVGVTTEWHHLVATDERYVMVEGEGLVEVTGMDPARVGPGDVVRIPASRRQRITNVGREDLIFFCICSPRFTPECYVAD
jgi:mannose-6-phosphate isomerase-like protein (cupin superfamily)